MSESRAVTISLTDLRDIVERAIRDSMIQVGQAAYDGNGVLVLNAGFLVFECGSSPETVAERVERDVGWQFG